MRNYDSGIWEIIKFFLKIWLAIFILLVVVSCIIYKTQIADMIKNNLWALFNAVMPIIMIILAIIYAVKKAFE